MAKLDTKPKVVKADTRRQFKRPKDWWLWVILLIVAAAAIWVSYDNGRTLSKVSTLLPDLPVVTHKAVGGKIESEDVLQNFSGDEVNALAHQNYDAADYLPSKNPVTKLLIKYTSIDATGQQIDEYARVYMPRTADITSIPVIVLAPGTTGIGDECAASLEDPAKANWANYESHAAAYAGQGYAVIIPDYEGMRDSSRIHHYMVGELEGRAVLDAAKATYSLSDYKNLDPNQLFLLGYSQGGHAVAFADEISKSYAPNLKITGLVAFAPVSDVAASLSDVTRGSTLDWFGPYILVSYSDYYKQNFELSTILQPKWIPNLKTDVLSHCINTVKFWPTTPDLLYTPEFVNALKDNTLLSANYSDLYSDIAQNQPWQVPTATLKLINQGGKDNVILPDQQTKVLPQICQGTGTVQLQPYADATHYTVMVKSYRDTLAWMAKAAAGQSLPTSCVKTQGVAQ